MAHAFLSRARLTPEGHVSSLKSFCEMCHKRSVLFQASRPRQLSDVYMRIIQAPFVPGVAAAPAYADQAFLRDWPGDPIQKPFCACLRKSTLDTAHSF